jgi:hypothetical protein
LEETINNSLACIHKQFARKKRRERPVWGRGMRNGNFMQIYTHWVEQIIQKERGFLLSFCRDAFNVVIQLLIHPQVFFFGDENDFCSVMSLTCFSSCYMSLMVWQQDLVSFSVSHVHNMLLMLTECRCSDQQTWKVDRQHSRKSQHEQVPGIRNACLETTVKTREDSSSSEWTEFLSRRKSKTWVIQWKKKQENDAKIKVSHWTSTTTLDKYRKKRSRHQ